MENDTFNKNNSRKITALFIFAGIILGLLVKFFVLDVLYVKGSSMEPTIKDGNIVLVNKLKYGLVKPFSDKLLFQWKGPEPDDIVIYLYQNKLVVKRCIAVQGMPLEYSRESGYNLIVNGKTYPLTAAQFTTMNAIALVPEGMILAIGDNAEVSIDSRNYGFVPEENVLGRVFAK